ncbi:uncharacterized protein LOC119382927 [Rhipicephalus sanguineus]|uniref:uncharacterized protein LOC119382927 n=1 Tax=Rhipicephalus sanguineus TaxID=34632 RepID=UPI0020C23AED|nr:uncharacterized protein LOC119382927 [Rhipicephalus sanguineus]
MADVQSICEVTPGSGEAVLTLKDAMPGKALSRDGSTTCVDRHQTFETRRLEGTSMEGLSGCTSSGFTTQTDASELHSEGRRGSLVPKSSSRSVPEKSCRSAMFHLSGDVGMTSASPTKSYERRPPVFRSPGTESLRNSNERLRGGRDGPVAHDARTGFATNLKLLAENLVNETAQREGTSPRACSLAPSEVPSQDDAEVRPQPTEEPADGASMTRLASQISEEAPAGLIEAPSTGAFTPYPTYSASAYEIDAAANEPPPLETVVVQPAPRPQSKSSVQVLRVEVPEAPVRPEHFSGSEAPMAGSTLPLNSEAPRTDRPPQALRHPRPHAIPPIAAPLCTRWCCAKISMISMAIMSLFAAFMIYAFREDTFVDLVNWAATWNTSSIRARFVVTQALIPEAENITESGILKQNLP